VIIFSRCDKRGLLVTTYGGQIYRDEKSMDLVRRVTVNALYSRVYGHSFNSLARILLENNVNDRFGRYRRVRWGICTVLEKNVK
jgi:hypothetical protein